MRWINALLTAALLATGLGTAAATPAAAAPPAGIGLDKQAPASVLLGDPIPYSLTASNANGNAPLYNVSFSDVLPAGFEYTGPTTPASAGEPKITTSGGRTVLTWSNVTDLQPGSSFTIEFTATPTAPLPTTIVADDTNTAYVAGSTNERTIPRFNADGRPATDPDVVSEDASATTKRAPFVVEKQSTNSPEGELLRGVHDQRSTYTLRIRNNAVVPTEDVTLTDYLPAELEFLGCGNEDNSQVVTEEYPNSGPLGQPAIDPTPCPTPIRVETVDSPKGVPGLADLSGVYTAVTWRVGTLAAGDVLEIKYVAGIPLFANTTEWQSPEVPATNGPQGSNLDNNNGASTREGIREQSITNLVSASGVFTGTAPSNPVVVTTDHAVQIEDVRMRKDASTGTFTPGSIVDFRFTIQASEYMAADDIRVTDTLPDGYCPLGQRQTFWPEEQLCDAGAAQPTVRTDIRNDTDPAPEPLDYATGTQWEPGSGTYTVNLEPVKVSDNGTTVVTLPARMLPTYRATGAPTVAGDSFEDTVTLTAITTPIRGVEGDPDKVGDDSQYTQGTALPAISKKDQAAGGASDVPAGNEVRPAGGAVLPGPAGPGAELPQG